MSRVERRTPSPPSRGADARVLRGADAREVGPAEVQVGVGVGVSDGGLQCSRHLMTHVIVMSLN